MSTERVALITGAASGIGRASVLRLLADGWSVVGADLNAENLQRLHAEATHTDYGDRLLSVHVDVSQESEIEGAVATTVEQFGQLDCMVNNAGVGGAFGRLTDIDVEDWDFTFAVLTRGVFLGTKHAARTMKAAGNSGSIVNIGSIAGHAAGAGPPAYSAAKAAVLNFSRIAAAELAYDRIRVNTLSPGAVTTPLLGGDSSSLNRLVESIQPWPDIGQPEDIAAVIAFLAGEESRFITGEVITVDGGMSAVGPRLWQALGDPAERGVSGVNHGTTGQESFIRRRSREESSARDLC